MAARQGGDVAQGPGKAADVAEALLRRRSWRGSDAPSAMARQRRTKPVARAFLPLFVLFRTEMEGGRSAQSRLSAAAHSLPASLLSFPELLLLGHSNDVILWCLNGLFKDYER
jgi:hypothetical protein